MDKPKYFKHNSHLDLGLEPVEERTLVGFGGLENQTLTNSRSNQFMRVLGQKDSPLDNNFTCSGFSSKSEIFTTLVPFGCCFSCWKLRNAGSEHFFGTWFFLDGARRLPPLLVRFLGTLPLKKPQNHGYRQFICFLCKGPLPIPGPRHSCLYLCATFYAGPPRLQLCISVERQHFWQKIYQNPQL